MSHCFGQAAVRAAPVPAAPVPAALVRAALVGLLLVAAAGCDRSPAIELVEGTRRSAELAAGEVHGYRLESPRESAVAAVVAQRGLDLAVTVLDAGGSACAVADRAGPPDGEESLAFIAEPDVAYRLEVRNVGVAGGAYEVRIDRIRAPTAEDRRRAAGDRAFARADALVAGEGRDSWLSAADRYRDALEAARALGDRPWEAEIRQRLGRLHRKYLEEKRVAIGHYEAALGLYRELGDDRSRSVVLNSLGRLHFDLGEMERAGERWNEALPIKRRIGDRQGEAATLANLALASRYLGEAQRALAFYDQSIELLRETGAAEASGGAPGDYRLLYLGRALNNRGKVYQALGQLDQALTDLERGLEVGERLGDLELEAITLTGIGRIRLEGGEVEAAVEALERGLALRVRVGTDRGRAVSLLALGAAYEELERRDEALAVYEQALGLFRNLELPRDVADALVAIASLVEQRGEPERALRLGGRALDLYRGLGDRAGEIEALLAMARAERGLGRTGAALSRSREALETIEALRTEAATPDLRASYLAALRDHFDFHLELLMDRHRRDPAGGFDRRALEASERFRARSLLDLLRESRDAALRRGDPELLARKQELERRIRLLEHERRDLTGGELEAVEARLGEAVREHRSIIGRIRAAAPAAAAEPRQRTLETARIQALLGADTALLEYYLGARRSYLWVVTPAAVTTFELPPRAEIERAARRAHEALQVSRRREFGAAAERALAALATAVLDPAAAALEAERLLIAADGALHYVPFAALPLPGGGGGTAPAAEPADDDSAGGTAHRTVVDAHRVVMVPSASALAALRREEGRRPDPSRRVAVLADPVFEPGDPRFPQPPSGDGDRPGNGPDDPAGRSRLRRLAFSGEEARALLAMVPPEEGMGAFGFEATRERATSPELGRYRIVHFATHGSIDTARPELSRLVFSQLDREGRPRDGSLFAFELGELELAADLVVLSGCETALGREIRGEGLVGLTQGLFDAGAAQVLVSLWQVDDRATAELTERFYRGLLVDGLPPAAALAHAQRSLRSIAGWRAPYYWAGFVLQGEAPR